MPKISRLFACLLLSASGGLFKVPGVLAEDWVRFRGAGGTATAQSAPPLSWDDTVNLKWKATLPGPGSSSPIVVGDRIFVTCYSGYGVNRDNPGDIDNLQRHLVSIRRVDGRIEWVKTVPAVQPEDRFEGFLAEHGYASNTPTTDGERVFVFFGKTGVLAFDFAGRQLWQRSVGAGSVEPHWGSATSLVPYRGKVIVNASDESLSLWALDAETGEVAWQFEDSCLSLAVGTPALITNEGQGQLLLACPDVLVSVSPDSGQLLWKLDIPIDNNIAPSVIVSGNTAFATGGLKGGTVAVDLSKIGKADSDAVHWQSRHYSYVATPVYDLGRLHWVDDRGIAFCLDAQSGDLLYRKRLPGGQFQGRPVYASPILAADKIYVVTRHNGVYVLAAKPEFEVLARNEIASDQSQFNATPAAANSELFLRSDTFLYCIAENP